MDTERVKQIIESHGVIEVLYRDSPVWINNIKDSNHVDVTVLDTEERMDVSIDQLLEN